MFDWFLITDRIFVDNIETAKVKAKQAVETSNIETDVNSDNDDVPRKRNRKRPSKLAEDETRDTDGSIDSPMKKKPIETLTSKGRSEKIVAVNGTQGTDKVHVRKAGTSKSSTKADCEKSLTEQCHQLQASAKKRLNLERDCVTYLPQSSLLSSSRKNTEIASEHHGWLFVTSNMQPNFFVLNVFFVICYLNSVAS